MSTGTAPRESPESATAERVWQTAEGVDPTTASFPVRAKVGQETILIFRIGAGYRGVERACPHQQATLMDAVLMANGTILRCTRHNFAFRLSDGKGVNCAGLRLKVYDVRVTEGRLEVAV